MVTIIFWQLARQKRQAQGASALNNLLNFVHLCKRKGCESQDRGSEESKLNLPIFEKLSNFIKLDITFGMAQFKNVLYPHKIGVLFIFFENFS